VFVRAITSTRVTKHSHDDAYRVKQQANSFLKA
jgi:hypothetical protein